MRALLTAVATVKAAGSMYYASRHRFNWLFLAAIALLAPLHTYAAVSITISPSTVNLTPSGTQQFAATVTGASDTSVIWTIQEGIPGGNVTSAGLYSAPVLVGTYHVVATSNADNTQSATATVVIPGFVTWGLNTPHVLGTATLMSDGTILFAGGTGGCASANAEVYNPATDKSTNLPAMVMPRCTQKAVLLPNGKVLLAGGQTLSGVTATAELYDPIARSFTATGSMSIARTGDTATLLPNGTVLIAGGGNCNSGCATYNTAEIYNPSTGVFSLTGSMSVPRTGHTATLLANGKVLIAGGYDCNSTCVNYSSAELYDPQFGTFTPTGSMHVPSQQGTATLLQNGNVLFTDALVNNVLSPSAEIYNPSSGTFSSTGSLNIAREGAVATLLQNGSVLIVGGTNSFPASAEIYNPSSGTFSLTGSTHEIDRTYAISLPNGTVMVTGGPNPFLTSTEFYDPSTGIFTSRATYMNVERINQAATTLSDGRILVTGGIDYTNNTPSATAEIFDPATGTFTLTGSMSSGRQLHTSTLLPNGNVLIIGGFSDSADVQVVTTAELYNPSSGTFTLTGSPGVPRVNHTATLLPNGKVLVAGGQVFNLPTFGTPSAELYDPSVGTFSPTGSMSVQRYSHTATLLPNGQVLIVGGIPYTNTIAGSAGEIYSPSTGFFTVVGPTDLIPWGHPFDSILMPNDQVLIGLGYLYDVPSNSFLVNPHGQVPGCCSRLALIPNGQVFFAGGTDGLIDPSTQDESLLTPPVSRQMPSIDSIATGPSAGRLLILGGVGAFEVDLYQPPATVPAPVVTSIAPNPVTGFTPVTITIQGANFTTGSVVMDDGGPLQTTFVSSSQLTAIFPTPNLQAARNHQIEVENVENPTYAPFTLTVVNPQLQQTTQNSGIAVGNVYLGSSGTSSASFTNIGNSPLTFDSIVISGTSAANFTFGPSTTCPVNGGTLAPQTACSVAIKFTPEAVAAFSANLTLNYETPASPLVLSISGTGLGVPAASVSPLSLTFGNQDIGTSSAPQFITISSVGTANLGISDISSAQDFMQTNNCPASLAPGSSCTIRVTFTPYSAGILPSAVAFITSDNSTYHQIPVSGTGIAIPAAAIAPLSLTFGSQAEGTSSIQQTVIIASTGTGNLAISSIVLTDMVDFRLLNSCPSSLAPCC